MAAGRRRTGTIVKVKTGPNKGQWQAVLTLGDGSRKRLPPFPKGTSEEYAKERAAFYSAEAERRGLKRPQGKKPVVKFDASDAWVEKWLADRQAADFSSVRENESHWRIHIQPVLGHKHVRDWTRDDMRALSAALRDKVRDKVISVKTAANVWATASKMCDDSAEHHTLRCREENPALGVRGPRDRKRSIEKGLQFLYPSEVQRFLAHSEVPTKWKILVALAVYTYMRAGELRVLGWDDVDLEHETILVHWAADRRGGVKATKGMQSRRVPIEPALLPVLKQAKVSSKSGLVVPDFPSERDLARGLRRWLQRAGVKRVELFNDRDTTAKLRFHDLRSTGVTWAIIRGDDPMRVRQRAGHADFSTTQRYIRLAETIEKGFGEPFPALRLAEFRSRETISGLQTAGILRGGRDSNPESAQKDGENGQKDTRSGCTAVQSEPVKCANAGSVIVDIAIARKPGKVK